MENKNTNKKKEENKKEEINQNSIEDDNKNKENNISNIKNAIEELKIQDNKGNNKINKKQNSPNEEIVDDYMKIINNNPESLFEIINENTLAIWQKKLLSNKLTIIATDYQIITTLLERTDQNTIIIDTKRTRSKERHLILGYEKVLELILTFYCNQKNINYRQGLNEIFGGFLLMQYKMKNLKLINVLNLGEAYIDRFLPKYYYEKDVNSVKSGIHLFSLLLKYHEPNIYYYLDKFDIPHELYVTNWILTLRAQRLKLNIYYELLDNLIKIDDPLFINFIIVSWIKTKREILLSSEGKNLLKILVNSVFDTKEELDNIIKISLELRNLTPYSFRYLANNMGLYDTYKKNIQNNFEIYNNNYIPTMPIYPLEVLYKKYFHTNKIICPDKNCPNNKQINKIVIDWGSDNINDTDIDSNYVCEKCSLNIEKNLNYIIIDLRLYPPQEFQSAEDYFKMGIISGAFEINKEELLSGDIDKLLSNRLLSIRGQSHIILMTSRTDYFNEFEERFYSDNTTELERTKMMLGIIKEEKTEKVLNLDIVENGINLKELYKLKEYDNFRKILNSLRDKNFPYVSYLEGGFEDFHQECLNYNIDLVEHDKTICKLCQNKKAKYKEKKSDKKLNKIQVDKNISETLWKNKMISINELNVFLSHEENVILICALRKFKSTFYAEKHEIFIIFLFDKKMIELYDKEKQISDKNSNYYNLGVNTQNNKDIMLRHFYTILFSNYMSVETNKNVKYCIELKIKNKEKNKDKKKDKNKENKIESAEFEFEFYSKEDLATFKSLMKKIKNSR